MRQNIYTLSDGDLPNPLLPIARKHLKRSYCYRTHPPVKARRAHRRESRNYRPRRKLPEDGFFGMDLLRSVYTLTQISYVTIDNLVFRLNSNATVILLVTFSIAVTTRQYVGNPIDCIHTRDIPEDVLNTYCWIHSTYTVIDALNKIPRLDNQIPYHGVHSSGKHPTKQVKYYQWVAFTLFFQLESLQETLSISYVPRKKLSSVCWVAGIIYRLYID